ncbi:unnamed protein product [Lupinus luteus]|uniref:C2H2-type domain-containing protein n=1 Tax=Lupinus luteus TaxID=3873 RepID=A0AAV1W5R8_LUPLU
MEKHKCKLCFRSFSNGRALGGHMRSHMMNYPLPAKPQASSSRTIQLSFEAESASSSSSEENSHNNNININNNDEKGVICYGLREKPKRSFRLEDPEFSSTILQDRETETESYKNRTWYETSNYRSRMTRKLSVLDDCNNDEGEAMMKKIKLLNKGSKIESWVVAHEPLSSVSDVSTEEDVAFCLMMMSRDNRWKRQKDQEQEQLMKNDRYYDYDKEEEEDDDEDEMERFLDEESDASSEEEPRFSKNKVRGGRYKCETCNKVFRSYQALGGHRASHKRIKVKISRVNDEQELENENGQALGGHKRTHVIGLAATSTTIIKSTQVSTSSKHENKFIDLNLPAQGDNGDDDINHIENSAVSDADFVKTH